MTGLVNLQLPEGTPAHGQTGELLDAARPAQGRPEHQRGDICPAGQSRFPLSSTEEHRMHAAVLREQPQQRPESGNAFEMQMHSKVIVFFALWLHHKINFKGGNGQKCVNANTHF